jgi:hypothetical protein
LISLSTVCTSNPKVKDDPFCTTMGLMGDICDSTYGEVKVQTGNCKHHNTLCNATSFRYCNCPGNFTTAPPECKTWNMPFLVFTNLAQNSVHYICEATNSDHSSCDKCTVPYKVMTGTPPSSPCATDPLGVLSDLCTYYTNNINCTAWKKWCTETSAAGVLRDTFCQRAVNNSLIKSLTNVKSTETKSGATKFGNGMWSCFMIIFMVLNVITLSRA